MSFIWGGASIDTIGDLFNGAVAAMRAGHAREFYDAYAASNEHAAANLGYVFGYADDDTRRDLYEAYRVVHPVTGTPV